MHTSKDDYLINTLRFVSTKEATQIYGDILPESLTNHEMKETKGYKTYLGFSTGAIPPKIARKVKKASPFKKDLNLNLVPEDEEPKSVKKKVPAKKTTRKQTLGVVIRDTPVESSSKRKEKVDVARGKGIKLLSEVALTEDAYEAESWGNDEDDSNNDNNSESDGSDEENDSDNKGEVEDDEEEKEDEYVRTLSYYSPTNDEDKTNVDDNTEGDEDEEMDYTTSQLYDDMDIWPNEPVQDDDETVQKEGTDAELTNIPQGNEKSGDHTRSKAEIVSPMDVPVHHEVPSGQTPTLLTILVLVIIESSLV
ncbi:hypothetical protein Tco_1139382 [Tanacetum coccineum]